MSVLLVALAYLLGSFPSGLVLTRLFAHRDVREIGSGNIGAANTARAAGLPVGIGTALLDILKGLLPVLLARAAGFEGGALALVAVAAVLGHDFSLFLRFKGGKGVATTLGVVLGLAPGPALMGAAIFVVALLVTRYTSVASLSALVALPLLLAWAGEPVPFVLAATVLLVLAVGKHAGNLVRLWRGIEPHFRAEREP